MARVPAIAKAMVLAALTAATARAQVPGAGPSPSNGVSSPVFPGAPGPRALVAGPALRPRVIASSEAAPEPSLAPGGVNTPGERSLVWAPRLGVSAAPASSESFRPATPAVRVAAGLRHQGPGVALMIVGGAGVLTGILIDEPIISVAGAGAGLYGLYLYVR